MKIVVLDGATLNPGDLSWDHLKVFGEYEVHDHTDPAQVVERSRDADAVLVNKVVMDRAVLEALPSLKYIGVTATGYNIVDVTAAAEKGIVVTNVPTYGTRSVAQMTFALLLELAHHVGYHSQTVHEGRWSASSDFCYWDKPLIELEGLTMGIIGFGRIGRTTAALAEAFGMNVIAHDALATQFHNTNVRSVDLDTVFAESDVVSLHCPLTPENNRMVCADTIQRMKKSAFLINTSRGQLVNEQDLADALNADRIAGAGLDVLSTEPPSPDNPLFRAKNCYITPHIAWATRSARSRLMRTVIDNLEAFVRGEPVNTVG